MQYSVIYSHMHLARQLFLGEIVEKKLSNKKNICKPA